MRNIIFFACFVFGCSSIQQIPEQVFTLPAGVIEWKINAHNEKQVALFIFPHPDDEIICAGTIATMKAAGWSVNLLTLTKGLNSQDKAIRVAEWHDAGDVLGYDHLAIHDFLNNSWDAVMGDSIRFWNQAQDTLKEIINTYIKFINPTVVVTYDDIIGGYGHPEHQITAALVHELYLNNPNTAPYNKLQLLQFTLPEPMEHFILGNLPSYNKAQAQLKPTKLLPKTTLFVDILDQWPTKSAAGNCYASQKQILQKFYLLPSIADTLKHYETFNKEYFFEVKR